MLQGTSSKQPVRKDGAYLKQQLLLCHLKCISGPVAYSQDLKMREWWLHRNLRNLMIFNIYAQTVSRIPCMLKLCLGFLVCSNCV